MLPLDDTREALVHWEHTDLDADITHADSHTTAHTATATFLFPPTLPVLRGHFPNNPLIPGVYTLATGLILARLLLDDSRLELYNVGRCKWTHPVYPEQVVACTIHSTLRDADLSQYHLKISATVAGTPCLSASILIYTPLTQL